MKKDIGFWDINGNYIEDIQEVSEMETKNFNEFFDELNDMANFKNFGETEETEEKEIIIDGVDVTGCRLYDYGICDSEMAEDLNCEKNPNCYYKQLKQLQQENAELKAENERLNRCMMEALHHEGEKIRETIKYKQTLQEIKAISEEFIKNVSEYCINTTPMFLVHKEILQKITKAEEE